MNYNQITERYYYKDGCLYNKKTHGNRAKKDAPVGTMNKRGYIVTNALGKVYRVHRLIYCYFNECGTDDISPWVVDHLNNNPSDNRIENLILCEQIDNTHNRTDTKRNGEFSIEWKYRNNVPLSESQREYKRKLDRESQRRFIIKKRKECEGD